MISPDVSILVVSYNTRNLLAGCLRSVLRVADEADSEIIVVDNSSPDGSADMVHREFPDVQLVRLSRNLGFAAAVNRGLDFVRGQFVLLLNPDTLVCRGALQHLRRFLDEHTRAAIAGAALTTADGRPLPSTFRFPTLCREFWNFIPELKSRLRLTEISAAVDRWRRIWLSGRRSPFAPYLSECISGAALMVRSSALREVGGLDSGFFIYHEEIDLCRRMASSSWEVWSVPEAQIIHFDAQATGFRPNRLPADPVLSWRVAGMDRYWSKHRPGLAHRLWRAQARGLLTVRVAALKLARGQRQASGGKHQRIRELRALVEMLRRGRVAEGADSEGGEG
jgi:GT2 family glycosyltransferase